MNAHAASLKKALAIISALCLLCLLLIPCACFLGPYEISPYEALRVFARILLPGFEPAQTDSAQYAVICHIRLARSCLALICGGALGVAGVALQGVLRNPLADPFTLGVSAGAACGASLAIAAIGPWACAGAFQDIIITMSALAGAFAALLCALALGRGDGVYSRERVILAGIAVAAFMGAIVALVKSLNEESVTSIVFWMLGSMQGKGWSIFPLLLVALVPGLAAVCAAWRKLDVLSLGDEQAEQLGLKTGRTRFLILAGASCMTAGCVAVCGIIGFVGLVIPHILRLILGPSHGPLLAASFFGGGIFMLLADCIARTILDNGQELPAGVVTALVGGPFFAYLIWKRQA